MITTQPLEVFNYYAYGMMIPDFFWNESPDYRFGFNSMLRDDDVRDEKLTSDNEGRGNSYDFGARILDPRVGRWLSLDPLMSKYPSVSSYNFTLNNPVNYIDPDGRVVIFINGQNKGTGGSVDYWRANNSKGIYSEFDVQAMDQIGDHNAMYLDGSFGGWVNTYFHLGSNTSNLSSKFRRKMGEELGKNIAFKIFENLQQGETIKIIAHSYGCATTPGIVEGIISKIDEWNNDESNPYHTFDIDKSNLFEMIRYYSPFQGSEINPPSKKLIDDQFYIVGSKDQVNVPFVGKIEGIPGLQPITSQTQKNATHDINDFNPKQDLNKSKKNGKGETKWEQNRNQK